MPPRPRATDLLTRYGTVPIASVAAIALLRWSLSPWLGQSAPLPLFTLAVLLVGWWGGLGPALLATLLSAAVGVWLFLEPVYSFQIADPVERMRVGPFLAVGALCSLVAEAMHRANRRAEARREWLAVTLASIGDAVIATDELRRVTFLNPQAVELTGWSLAEAEGRPLEEIFRITRAGTDEPLPCPVREVLATGRIVRLGPACALLPRASPGACRLVDATAAPIAGRSGQMIGGVLVFRDVTEKHEAARQLREFADTAPAMLWATDAPGSCTFLSRGWYEFTGQGEDEGLGYGWLRAVHPEDVRGMTRAARAANARQEAFSVEHRVRRSDGVYRWVICAGRPRRSPGLGGAPGEFVGFVGSVIDITDRRQIEQALRTNDQRLKLFVENIRDYAVLITDPEGRLLEWMGGAEKITGHDAQEVLGQRLHFLFTEADRAAGRPEEEMQQALEEGRSEDKRWHVRKDGSLFFADGVTAPIFDEAHKLQGFGKVFRDRTEQKRTEDTVRFLADASAALVELVDDESTLGRVAHLAVQGFADACVVDLLDSQGSWRRIEASRGLLSRSLANGPDWGLPAAVRTGRSAMVCDVTDAQELALEPALGDRGVRSYICVPLVSRGKAIGAITFLTAWSGHRLDAQDLSTVEDLARRVTIALENARLSQALQEADRRKDEFLATLAHELRNPLAPVRTGLHILRKSPSGPSADRTREMMERQLGHMVRLVDDLLDVSRVSRGTIELRRQRVDLGQALADAVETSRPALEAGQHELQLDIPDEPVWLQADLTRLAQVFANLLNNAAKYTPSGGRVGLRVQPSRDEVTVSVTDSGAGIPGEMLGEVFEMFAQVNRTLDRSQGGLGIGLALVKQLVGMHGGTIEASSPGLGQGSTFTVRLPLAAPAPAPAPEDEDSPVGQVRRRVLVVDDNEDGAESLAMLLSILGHEARTAHDGPQALELASQWPPEIVFLDIGMPGMNGHEVARRLKRDPVLQSALLVALTGWGSEEDKAQSRAAGFDLHLTKPVEPSAVQAAIDRLPP